MKTFHRMGHLRDRRYRDLFRPGKKMGFIYTAVNIFAGQCVLLVTSERLGMVSRPGESKQPVKD